MVSDAARAELHAAVWKLCVQPLLDDDIYRPIVQVDPDAWRTGSDDVVWITCKTLMLSVARAVVLVAVLARVDLVMWKEVVREIWPSSLWWAELMAARPGVRIGLEAPATGIDIATSTEGLVKWLHRLCSRRRERDARDLMARMLGENPLPVVPVRINFEDFSFEETDDIPGQLERDIWWLGPSSGSPVP